MTERVLTQVKAPDMGFLRRLRCDTRTYRGKMVPRARKKFGAPRSNRRSFGSKCTVLKKKLAPLLGFFGTLQWFGARGIIPLRYVYGVTLRDKVRSCEIWKVLKITCPNWEITATLVRPSVQNSLPRTGETSSAGLTHGKAAQRSSNA